MSQEAVFAGFFTFETVQSTGFTVQGLSLRSEVWVVHRTLSPQVNPKCPVGEYIRTGPCSGVQVLKCSGVQVFKY